MVNFPPPSPFLVQGVSTSNMDVLDRCDGRNAASSSGRPVLWGRAPTIDNTDIGLVCPALSFRKSFVGLRQPSPAVVLIWRLMWSGCLVSICLIIWFLGMSMKLTHFSGEFDGSIQGVVRPHQWHVRSFQGEGGSGRFLAENTVLLSRCS